MSLSITEKSLYERNKGFLYLYSDNYAKLTVCRSVRSPGWEEREEKLPIVKGSVGNDSKLAASISRAKATVFELARCNDWDYFVTLTFDQQKVQDRYALSGCVAQFRKWLNHYNERRPGANVKYLLIPEKHKDGAFHLHGLVRGIPADDLLLFSLSDTLPKAIRNKLQDGQSVYNWVSYASKFGYCIIEKIRSKEGVSAYMTKYITKDLQNSISELNLHLYYASKGLNRKQLLYSAPVYQDIQPDYKTDYVAVKIAEKPEELLPYFCDLV